MKITRAKTLFSGVATLIVVATLVGCKGHQNPLSKAAPKEAASFLVQASVAAEKQLKVFRAPGGYQYGRCMSGHTATFRCLSLYKAMAVYAKTSPAFKAVTQRDLMDKTMFKQLKEDYQREQFNNI